MKIQKWVVLSAAMLAIFTACGGSNKPAETTEDVQMTAEPVVEEVAAPNAVRGVSIHWAPVRHGPHEVSTNDPG